MSGQDDVEVMEALIKGCEKFVAKEVASLMKQLNAQKEENKGMEARIGVLEIQNQNLEAEVSKLREESRAGHASCLERLQSALMSATLSLSNDEITQPPTKETVHENQSGAPKSYDKHMSIPENVNILCLLYLLSV